MKTYIYPLIASFFILLTSCEDVIQVDLDKAAPRLVIDAGIIWDTTNTGADQTITITQTRGYYENYTPTISNAVVQIRNKETNDVFDFTEKTPNTGQYTCVNFIPVINNTYVLTVTYNNIIYTAEEKLIETPDISKITKSYTKQQFGDGEIFTEVNIYFQDNPDQKNYYLFAAKPTYQFIYEYRAFDDENSNGREMKGVFFNDKMKEGQDADLSLLGISLNYYEYLNILLNVSQSSGNPFGTPPSQSTLGNIVNTSNDKNNPYGFFRLSQLKTAKTDASHLIIK